MSVNSGYPGVAPAAYTAVASDVRATNRTPSLSPSEVEALNQTSLFNFRSMFQKEKIFTTKFLIYSVIGIIILVIFILLAVFDKQIVSAIQPTANKIHSLPAGWLIPIAIFFVLSFPPLFGQEILAIVCGLVWGVWAGFGITVAGMMMGEIGNFYVFRYFLRSYAEKLEHKNIQYSCLSKIVREGGFKIALIVRYSAVPGHFATAIFSVCGMNIFVFILAALLSMPQQFINVYIGTLLETGASGSTTTTDKIVSYVVTAVTILVTVAAMWYIRKEVNRVKPDVIYARRKARQAKMYGGDIYRIGGLTGSTDGSVFNPDASDVNLIDPHAHSDNPYEPYQRWDRDGRAVGYADDPKFYAPQPRRADSSFDVELVAPTGSGSASGARQPRQESTDTARWAQQMNAADGAAFPLHAVEPDSPVESESLLLERSSSETVVPPGDLPQTSSPIGEYAFTSSRHDFRDKSGNQARRAFTLPSNMS